jgi:hypothetical protein
MSSRKIGRMREDADRQTRMQRVLSGALRLWAVPGSVERVADAYCVRTASGPTLRIVPAAPRGWAVHDGERTLGVHAGLPGLLRQLREELAPDAPRGRLIVGAQPLR